MLDVLGLLMLRKAYCVRNLEFKQYIVQFCLNHLVFLLFYFISFLCGGGDAKKT